MIVTAPGPPLEIAAGTRPIDLADQAFSRATGAPLLSGNAVRILRDAKENYPAWLDAIRGATRRIHFESYIFDDDPVGREFAAALAERARAGVRVRVVYDWLGTWGSGALWALLREAGAEVRCFNPPRFDSPLGWLSRDHRKTITVDDRIGFVTGLCVSAKWQGDPTRGLEPWRDTGIELHGPSVAELQRAFAIVWSACGGNTIPPDEFADTQTIAPAGDVDLRVVASLPNVAGVFRLDQMVAGIARERLWLTDAYFVGMSAYVEALRAAARDGVDVRLLVPGASDVPAVSALSRAGYRPLLEAGVRVFEWNGTMLHAKSAVADGAWARVGSTNLNIASWTQNYELDVFVQDERFAAEMVAMYEDDLARATEIVLTNRNRVRRSRTDASGRSAVRRASSGSAGRAAAGALSVGSTVGAAITNRRVLGPAESGLLAKIAVVLLAVAAVFVTWPELLAVPLALIATWLGGTMLWKAWTLRRAGRAAERRDEKRRVKMV